MGTISLYSICAEDKEITDALRKRKDVDVEVNTDRPADIIHIQTMGLYSFRRLMKKGGKKVVSAHIVPDSFIGSIKGAKYWKPLGKMWLKFFYRKADLVLAPRFSWAVIAYLPCRDLSYLASKGCNKRFSFWNTARASSMAE